MRLSDLTHDFSKGGAESSSGLRDLAQADGVLSVRYNSRVVSASAFSTGPAVALSSFSTAVLANEEADTKVNWRPIHLATKRLTDIVGAALGLLLLSPLLIVVAAIIKLTSAGPIFFRQERTGLDNKPFQILKFRSMYTDRCDLSGVAQTVADDPRVTPIGRVIRKTNIDELPQLFNVLLGDMSLVGPRPHVPGMLAAGVRYEELVNGYERRHAMRPGITGLAQASGLRGPTTEVEPSVMRVVRDIEYIRDFSIWLDIRILFRTVINEIMRGKGF
ncbi:exopolysaccharide biosynthesis protein [Pleomorphomonas diazotrophica]|uniref:Exopolysaccharide biosynthesis protein n=1 Tax=Pleomorphomonas diazotrophica TaxID=1166257 RepID=A0A1I4RKB3_9HYPH|nr:sugar transferase [Pleomorphomonas diazotrophica]PKR87512.1 exopolysaccharide biosynthesis protein [Pleomorphomonas diazotrophica]SFM52687.1 Sugar transferase involved in LPS biosynthesis (colanic, teichoic acid) [Pleomorphomonas diazotrophica]